MSIHKEISFEVEICAYLSANGWLHAEGDAALYDRARALFPPDLVAWVPHYTTLVRFGLIWRHGSIAVIGSVRNSLRI